MSDQPVKPLSYWILGFGWIVGVILIVMGIIGMGAVGFYLFCVVWGIRLCYLSVVGWRSKE